MDCVSHLTRTFQECLPLIELVGSLELFDQGSSADIEWSYGQRNYTARLECLPTNSLSENSAEQTVKGGQNLNTVKYEGGVLLKYNENEKSVLVDLESEQRICLLLEAGNGFNDIKLDFMWDRDEDTTKRIVAELEARFVFLINDIDILFGLKTSNPIFSNIRSHIKFLVETDGIGSKLMDSLIELRLNEYQHKVDVYENLEAQLRVT